jgi:hypothetical protein
MNHIEVANSGLMLFLCFMVIFGVTIQALLFIRKAWKRGAEMGIGRDVMKKTMINSAIFSIVPTLPIIISLMVLSVNLGQYFPWLRLSVVGSAVYEIMAADTAAKALGLSTFSAPGMNLSIFSTMMWVMTGGIVAGIVFNILLMKSLDKFSKKAKSSGNNFIPIGSAALFIGMMMLMAAPYLTNLKSVTAIISFVSAALAAVLCNKIAKTANIKIIDDFSLPISLIVGMIMAILYANILA